VAVSENVIPLVAQVRRFGVRYIWVDQLSINQASENELATQITLMRIIYERAWKIFIWLGEERMTATWQWPPSTIS
jgi:hypothetical protein